MNSVRVTRATVIALSVGLSSCAGNLRSVNGNLASVEWSPPEEFKTRDREAIVQLAERVGFALDRVVPVRFAMGRPEFMCSFEGHTAVAVQGNRRIWSTLEFCRGTPPRDVKYDPEVRWVTVDRWTTDGHTRHEERWRVPLSTNHVDVSLDTGVRYEDAVRIITAIDRKTLVNRLWEYNAQMRRLADLLPELYGRIPRIDARHILSVKKDSTSPPQGGFTVTEGQGISGTVLFVRIRDGQVEVYAVSSWIS